MSHFLPQGFRFSGVHCGLKRDPQSLDISLIVTDDNVSAAGVYTQNRVVAAPVILDRARTPSGRIRAVIVNSGNANACTGEQGMDDAREMARATAEASSVGQDQVLVMSTGIIGEHLDMAKVTSGIKHAANQLGDGQSSLIDAARGMMTTDNHHKVASQSVECGKGRVSILGIAKGAGMIGPRMATMLAVIMTDATVAPDNAQGVLEETVDSTFNCISVEGHTSTNDAVVLLCSGKASSILSESREFDAFRNGVQETCTELAKMIPNDGEGATHLIEITVDGCETRQDARQIARTIADSPLVKTAITGADPNWGRIVSAAGYAGVAFDPSEVELALNGTLLFQRGAPISFDPMAVSDSIRANRETKIELTFQMGDQSTTFWTSDLTTEYIRINADYHT